MYIIVSRLKRYETAEITEKSYESGGQRFESFRARHSFQDISEITPFLTAGLKRFRPRLATRTEAEPILRRNALWICGRKLVVQGLARSSCASC